MRDGGRRHTRRCVLRGAVAAVVATLAAPALAQREARQPRDESRWARMGVSLDGATALVTGSTDGLGREVARQLGALGAFVIVHGRDAGRGAEVVDAIRSVGGDAEFIRADLAAMADVDAFASELMRRHDRLDLLVNNAAAPGSATRRLTPDGYEMAFAVNHLAHFLLTYRLLPLLEAGAPSRVVNVSSMGQAAIDFDDVMMERGYDSADAYRRSKLAQIMFTFELAPRLDPATVTVNAVHPARSMDTRRMLEAGFEPRSTVGEGAEATMQLAVSPELGGRTGHYFHGLDEARAHDQAYDEAARARLWALSMELTGLAVND